MKCPVCDGVSEGSIWAFNEMGGSETGLCQKCFSHLFHRSVGIGADRCALCHDVLGAKTAQLRSHTKPKRAKEICKSCRVRAVFTEQYDGIDSYLRTCDRCESTTDNIHIGNDDPATYLCHDCEDAGYGLS